MPKIRDLGINVIPQTMRPPEIGGGGGCWQTCVYTPADCVPGGTHCQCSYSPDQYGGCTQATQPCNASPCNASHWWPRQYGCGASPPPHQCNASPVQYLGGCNASPGPGHQCNASPGPQQAGCGASPPPGYAQYEADSGCGRSPCDVSPYCPKPDYGKYPADSFCGPSPCQVSADCDAKPDYGKYAPDSGCGPSPCDLSPDCPKPDYGKYAPDSACGPSPCDVSPACPKPAYGDASPHCYQPHGRLTRAGVMEIRAQLQRKIEQLDEYAKTIGPKTIEQIEAREQELREELEELARRRRELETKDE